MPNLTTWFGWTTPVEDAGEIPEIFPITFKKDEFIQTDIVSIYSKILTDVVERTNGLSDAQQVLLWDNCLKSSSSDGVVTMLAKAMADKKELFIVYDPALEIVRHATGSEIQQIKSDYDKENGSDTGIYISFRNYVRSDMIRLYSALEFSTVSSLQKSMNLSRAIQIKIGDLRGSTALNSSAEAKKQAQTIAAGLSQGKDVLLDAQDKLETAIPDLTAVKAAIDFLDSKRAFYLGLPESYINGVQTGGLGTTGENDTKAIERGLKSYYFSIIKPVVEAIFDVNLTYKSQDFRQIDQALEALKTFELVGEDLISIEAKRTIIGDLLDIQSADVVKKTDGAETPDPRSRAVSDKSNVRSFDQ